MTNPVSRHRRIERPRFGVGFDEMTDPVLHGIVSIYYEVALDQSVDPVLLEPSYCTSDIDSIWGVEYRIGSMLNRHSKLYIVPEGADPILEASFYPNHQRLEDENPGTAAYELGASIGHDFAQRVDQLLLALGIGRPIPRY